MKFYICTPDFDCEDSEEIVLKYPVLNNYGFGTETSTVTRKAFEIDDRGRWHDTEESETVNKAYVIVDTIDELMKLAKDVRWSIIIHYYGDEWKIEIYDDYRE